MAGDIVAVTTEHAAAARLIGVGPRAYRAVLCLLPPAGRAWLKAALALPQILPQAPARPLEYVTSAPPTQPLTVSLDQQAAEEIPADLYLPAEPGRRMPGVVLTLGANDLGGRDPRVIGLADGLARSGFATLVVTGSPALAEADGPLGLAEAPEVVAAAFEWLAARADVDEQRIGLMGICFGGSACLMAAAKPALAARVAFVYVIGPYLSMRSLLRAMASRTTVSVDGQPRPWPVEAFALERQRSWLLRSLAPVERVPVQATLSSGLAPPTGLSERAQAIRELAHGVSAARADELIDALGEPFAAELDAVSPASQLAGLRAETFVMHGVADGLIPVDESRRLVLALRGQVPVHYAEFELFDHADPTRPLAALTLVRELARLLGHVRALMRFAA
jgi:hypothetical protein